MTVRDGNGDRERNKNRHAELAQGPPQITVLSDGALPAEQAHRDTFDLWVKLGPIYDIIRHPDTQTPIAIGVFGRWGSGKTTAMRWLQGSLEVWNEQEESTGNEPKISVRTVWFDPWKYDSREDVWRGLLAEVILTSLEGKSRADAKKVLKDFGRFLGSSFIDVLDARFKWGVKHVADNARSFLRPDKEYLNEYENKMCEWLEESLGPNQRMVIFIDDLDRCLPEVALEVLEGIKLYLGFEQLIFVVGVDKTMIEYLVQAHYDEVLKLESSKAVDTALVDDHQGDERRSGRDYLAKMFQVEVILEPTQQEIRGFLEEQLDSLGFLSGLDPDELTMLKDLILELAQQSPREVNRLLNSALMAGAGSRYASDASDHEQDVPEDLRFRQGLQGLSSPLRAVSAFDSYR